MPSMTEVKCKKCKKPFMARTADVNRGWGKFCSKSCKAKEQENRTGATAKFRKRRNKAIFNSGRKTGTIHDYEDAHPFSSEALGQCD